MSRNRKKPTNKEMVQTINGLRNDLIFLDQKCGETWRHMMNLTAAYIEFNKDGKEFEKFMKAKIKKQKKEKEKAEKEAKKKEKSQENKVVTAK